MRRVIVESPFAAPTAAEQDRYLRYLRAALRDCLMRGEAPFASHGLYTLPGVLDYAEPDERQLGITAGFVWRSVAEATIVYTDLGISAGMRAGIENAKLAELPVEYRSLPGWKRDESVQQITADRDYWQHKVGALLRLLENSTKSDAPLLSWAYDIVNVDRSGRLGAAAATGALESAVRMAAIAGQFEEHLEGLMARRGADAAKVLGLGEDPADQDKLADEWTVEARAAHMSKMMDLDIEDRLRRHIPRVSADEEE